MREKPWCRGVVSSEETLQNIEESRTARLAGNLDQDRTLTRRTRALLRRDKDRYIRELAEDVKGYLNADNLRPVHRALKTLRSRSITQTSTIRTADRRIVSNADEGRSRWAEYFEQLYVAEPLSRRLSLAGVKITTADPPVNETPPSLAEVRVAVNKLKSGKAVSVCNVIAETLKASGGAMIHGLHASLLAVWQ